MPTNIGSIGNKNKRTSTNSKKPTNKKVEAAKTLSRREKERKLLEELGSEQPGMSKRKKIAIGATAGVLGATAILVPTVKYLIDNQKHIITMKVQGTHFETYKLEVKKGSLIKELKTYTITGYTLVGFFKDEACTVRYTDSERVTKNSTVYCKYEPITYTVTYPTNQEGYIVNAEEQIEYGNKFIFTVTVLDRYNKSNVVVKVNGKKITANEYGQYIISFVETNLNITVENVVRNKVIVNLNLGSTTAVIEAEEDATLQELLEENETLIKQEIISTTLQQNPNTYTQEQLENLSLTDLLSVTTAGLYLDNEYTKETDLNIPLVELGETINVNTVYATLDKFAFSDNSVKAKDYSISGKIVIPKAYLETDPDTNEIYLKDIYSIQESGFAFTNITEITIPSSVTNIGQDILDGCTSLTRTNYLGDINSWVEIYNKGYGQNYKALYINNELVTSVTIDTATKINRAAFDGITSLTNVTIGESVTSIGYRAFYGCTSLTSIEIPSSVTSIENYAFSSCVSLESIEVDRENAKYHDSGNCLIETASKTLKIGCKNSIIPTDGSVTRIGVSAFDNCTSLKEITIPNSVTIIDAWAFYYCTGLTEIVIPDSITSIGNQAFDHCTGLRELVVPDSVTSIGDYAFQNCTGVEKLSYNANITKTYYSSANIFGKMGENVEGCVVIIGENVTTIPAYFFCGVTALKEINIPNSVTSIGKWAFSKCENLTSVTFENTSGWWYSTSLYATSGKNISATNLENATTAATYLKSTYYNYYWKRTV